MTTEAVKIVSPCLSACFVSYPWPPEHLEVWLALFLMYIQLYIKAGFHDTRCPPLALAFPRHSPLICLDTLTCFNPPTKAARCLLDPPSQLHISTC